MWELLCYWYSRMEVHPTRPPLTQMVREQRRVPRSSWVGWVLLAPHWASMVTILAKKDRTVSVTHHIALLVLQRVVSLLLGGGSCLWSLLGLLWHHLQSRRLGCLIIIGWEWNSRVPTWSPLRLWGGCLLTGSVWMSGSVFPISLPWHHPSVILCVLVGGELWYTLL